MSRALALAALMTVSFVASGAAAPLGTLCGGTLTAGGGLVIGSDGTELSSAIGEALAGAPAPTTQAPGILKSGYLYRPCSGSVVVAAPPDAPGSRRTLLHPSRPNPFNPRTEVGFELAEAGRIQLELYDAAGRHVRTLVDRPMPPGPHSLALRADGLSSGVYYLRLRAAGETRVRSVVLVK